MNQKSKKKLENYKTLNENYSNPCTYNFFFYKPKY